MMKRSSRQFGNWLSGFGRQSEKFRRIGTCIRCNFTPWNNRIVFNINMVVHHSIELAMHMFCKEITANYGLSSWIPQKL